VIVAFIGPWRQPPGFEDGRFPAGSPLWQVTPKNSETKGHIMSHDPHDVVRVGAGDLVTVELYQQRLAEEGIEARVVGDDLGASFGTAIPMSVEVWAHRSDAPRALAIIQQMDEEHGRRVLEPEHFPHPVSDPAHPSRGGHGPHTHYDSGAGK
jgi:hypothetical protein